MLFAIDTRRKERRPGSGGANRLSDQPEQLKSYVESEYEQRKNHGH
jgi:hypothetical protein